MQMPGPIIRHYAAEVQSWVFNVPMKIWMETTVRALQVELVQV